VETVDVNNSGIFDYDESNHAMYISMSKDWTNWSLSAGVRTEYTDAVGKFSNELDENAFDYFKTFPTANITHRFNDKHSLGISYRKSIERPTYTNLNPFRFFFNDNTFGIGNPNLQPAITQLATLSYSINDTYTFEVYYRDEEGTFSELSFQNNTTNQSQTDNSIQSNQRWSFYGNAINYFNLSKDNSLTSTLSLLYISPIVSGSSEVLSRSQVDIAIKKSFAKGKWIMSLSANDIFRGSDETTTNQYLDQNNSLYARFDNRWVRLGLRYNFGNTKLSTNKNIKDLDERNRLNKTN